MSQLRMLALVAAGVAVGLLFARFQAPDYLHASLTLQEGGEARKPLYITPGSGKRTLALSLRNQQEAADVQIRVDGGVVESSHPPPLPLPFRPWPEVKEGLVKGLQPGMKIPLVVVLDGRRDTYELLFERPADHRVIQRVAILRGESHGHH